MKFYLVINDEDGRRGKIKHLDHGMLLCVFDSLELAQEGVDAQRYPCTPRETGPSEWAELARGGVIRGIWFINEENKCQKHPETNIFVWGSNADFMLSVFDAVAKARGESTPQPTESKEVPQ